MDTDSPAPPRQLKRLRKASDTPEDPPHDDSIPDASHPPEIGADEGEGDGLDPLFGGGGQFTGCDAGDLGREAEGVEGGTGSPQREKKSAKKRLCLDGGEEGEKVEKKRQKRRRKRKGDEGKSGGADGSAPGESAREKRRLEKERKAYLEHLHSESQRLLRETKDASFKPAQLVQKPISSVLEKIRLRKLEVLKSMDSPAKLDSCENVNYYGSDTTCFQSGENENSKNVEEGKNILTDKVQDDAKGAFDNLDEDTHHGSCQIPTNVISGYLLKSAVANTYFVNVLGSDHENANHSPEIDIQDIQDSFKSPFKHEENRQPGKQPDNSPENDPTENNVQCQPMTNSKHDMDLTDEISSDGEDYDKENTDPLKDNTVNFDLFGKTDLAKPFVDDEAEEEDDSDHDLMRFPEEDEDDGGVESEELDDLIATAYEEMPLDQERRNQLHQEWLEQKDAAETHKVLQRLKHRQRKEDGQTTPPNEYSIKDLDEEPEAYSLHEDFSANQARENSKKAKEMMVKMFDGKDDGFVSSDDEETEQRLSRQRILKQTEEHTSILSPVDNANSREVFSLIKKLNIAPDPKKRLKPIATTYEPLHLCGNSNSSSKSSFLGRVTSNSLQSSHKQSNATFKSFVFGRDESSGRSAISKPEDVCDTDEGEAQQTRTGSARFTSSQSKSICSKSAAGVDNCSGPSLFEILRRSSVLYDRNFKGTNQRDAVVSETQVAHQLTAFKLGSKISKR